MRSDVTSGAAGELFRAGEFEIVRTDHPPEMRLRRHDHAAATMVIVEEGDFQEVVGRRSFYCVPGSILVKPGGAHHSNRYGAGGSKAILVALPEPYAVPDVRFLRNTAVMRTLVFELAYGDAASALVSEGIVVELLAGSPRTSEATRKAPPPWLRMVEERLRCDPSLGLTSLAEQGSRNAAHLAREFRRHYGCSPGQYARSARIERACRALRQTDEPISSIALAAGFFDQSHFTNAFRQVIGTTPAEYRRRTLGRSHQSSKTATEPRP